MATTTQYLKLRLTPELTANARYNLARIDALASVFIVDTSGGLRVRSIGDILIEPQSADIGGSGADGYVDIGTADHTLSGVRIYGPLVLSVGLTDAEIADDAAIAWSKLSKVGSDLAELETRSHTDLDDIGSNTHAQIDTHISTVNAYMADPAISPADLDVAAGAAGQVLGLDGSGNLVWLSVATEDLFESRLNIGNASNMKEQVDTSALGNILATTTGGLTYKAGSVSNSHIAADAAIEWTKIDKTGSNLTDIDTRSHTALSDIGSNTHADIDMAVLDGAMHIAASSTVHGLSGTVVGTSDTQTLTAKTIVVANNTVTTAASGNLTATELNNALAELQTDIDTRATSSALTTHTGASTGVHGVSGSVVGTTDTQTLTGKTISGASNTLTILAATQLSGATPIANGGTGQTAKAAAFDALSPNTTQGDISYRGASNNVRLGIGTALQVLRVNAGVTALEWGDPSALAAGQINDPSFFTTGAEVTQASPGVVKSAGQLLGTNTNDPAATGYVGEVVTNSSAITSTASSGSTNTYTAITNGSINITAGAWLITYSVAYTSTDYGVVGVTDDGAVTGLISRSNKSTGIVSTADTVSATIPYSCASSKTLTLFMKNKSAAGMTVFGDDAIASTLTNDGTSHITAIRIR